MATTQELLTAAETAYEKRANKGFILEYTVGDTTHRWESADKLREHIEYLRSRLAAEGSTSSGPPFHVYHARFPRES